MAVLYEEGMMVKLIGEQIKKHGEGPYEVIEIEFSNNLDTQGIKPKHPQLVTIQTPKGKLILSGYWLIPA